VQEPKYSWAEEHDTKSWLPDCRTAVWKAEAGVDAEAVVHSYYAAWEMDQTNCAVAANTSWEGCSCREEAIVDLVLNDSSPKEM